MGCITSKHASVTTAPSPLHHETNHHLDDDHKPAEHSKKGKSGRFSIKLGVSHRNVEAEQVSAGWPPWLSRAAGDAIHGWVPLRSNHFEKLEKIGQGTYSSVFKAREVETGKLVALKKVRFDNFQTESIRFMAREISILRKVDDHPNLMKLNGVITSRLSTTIYLVFDYMDHDLAGLTSSPHIQFTQPQIKCYMKQLLSGVEHCHERGVMHRDIKTSNILVNNEGVLKLADFGLANVLTNENKQRLTSRVVTLWYRPPELLMGSTNYGVTVDLWSVGCVFAELLTGKPILKGRTEVEQLHKVFKLCGSPSEEFWKKHKLPRVAVCKYQNLYENCLHERFKDDASPPAMPLLETLLSVEPQKRGIASSALASQYFQTEPYPCEPSCLPRYPPNKEIDARIREDLRRKTGASMQNPDSSRKSRTRGSINHSKAELREEKRDRGQSSNKHSSRSSLTAQGDVYRGPPQVPGSRNFAWAKKNHQDANSTLSDNEPCSKSQVRAADSSSLVPETNTFTLPRPQNNNAQEGICADARQQQAEEDLNQRNKRRASHSNMMSSFDREAINEGKEDTMGPTTLSQLLKFNKTLQQSDVNHASPPDRQIEGQ